MPDPLNIAIQTRPTPVVSDGMFWEMVDGPETENLRPPYGSAYPDTAKYDGFFFCKEERLSHERARRWWAKEFTLQDTYNDSETYSSQDADFPIFTRRYVKLRSKYAPLAVRQPLLGIVAVEVTAGGTGYTEPPVVTASGGTGADAEFTALINQDGEVCGVIIDAAGTYSVAPTLAFSGGNGNGAAATAKIQPQAAILVIQRKVELAEEDPRRSIFVQHEAVYESLPGPLVLVDFGYEEETQAQWRIYTQRVEAGSSAPAPTDEFPASSGFFVEDAGIKLDDNNNVGTMTVKVMEQPASRVEYVDGNFQPPDNFVPIPLYGSWPIPPRFPGCPSGPYQNRTDGLDFSGTPLPNDLDHRGTYELQVATPASPFKDTITYFITPPGALPATFSVTSQPSRFLPVSRDTIHTALTLVAVDAFSNEVVIENLRESTPSTYTPGTTVVNASQKQWRSIWMKRIVRTVVFPTLPN